MRGGVSRCKAGLDFERGENQLLGTRRHQLMEKRESIHLTLVSILPFFSLSWGCGRLRTTWLGPLRTFRSPLEPGVLSPRDPDGGT